MAFYRSDWNAYGWEKEQGQSSLVALVILFIAPYYPGDHKQTHSGRTYYYNTKTRHNSTKNNTHTHYWVNLLNWMFAFYPTLTSITMKRTMRIFKVILI